jgi:uncharacterized protein (DUF488 family)
MKIFTIGYGNRNPRIFFQLLKDNGINILIDVRRKFTRAWATAYTPQILNIELTNMGIMYKSWNQLSNSCGTLRGYSEWLNTTSEGEIEMARLSDYLDIMCIQNKIPVIMCAEFNPEFCHRKIITDFLAERGYEVCHI